MANDNIEVFENNFEDNNSANVLIVSYLINEIPITDPNYDPFPEAIYLHNNQYTGGGESPDSEPLALLQAATGQALPDIIWDGMLAEGKTAADALCFSEAADTSFVSLDASNGFAKPVFDAAAHDCVLPRLTEISMSLSSQ